MKLPTVVISFIFLTMAAQADPFTERQEIAIKIVEILKKPSNLPEKPNLMKYHLIAIVLSATTMLSKK